MDGWTDEQIDRFSMVGSLELTFEIENMCEEIRISMKEFKIWKRWLM